MQIVTRSQRRRQGQLRSEAVLKLRVPIINSHKNSVVAGIVEKCNEVIDMFEDLEHIGQYLRNDPRKTLIALNVNHIIILRTASIELCKRDRVNERHEYILTYFYKLLQDLYS